jgi:hypothetical protein
LRVTLGTSPRLSDEALSAGIAGGGFIYHGHRPVNATKYLLRFADNPRPGIQQAYDRVSAEYVYKGFVDESIFLQPSAASTHIALLRSAVREIIDVS